MPLAFIGFAAFLQCVVGGICLDLETKDDLTRPPASSKSDTSYEKVGEIHTYSGDRLVKSKDWKGYVTRTRVIYHQIPKKGVDYFMQLWGVLVIDALVICVCFYYGKEFYIFQKQVSLVQKMGTEQWFENGFYNEMFARYGDGIGAKAMQIGIGVGLLGALNVLCFLVTVIFVVLKVGVKSLFCF